MRVHASTIKRSRSLYIVARYGINDSPRHEKLLLRRINKCSSRFSFIGRNVRAGETLDENRGIEQETQSVTTFAFTA